jgi:cation diffusion facilitator family transporter
MCRRKIASRGDRLQDEKEKVALGSIAASAGLTLAKGLVGLATGSLAILSEAAHSLLDLVATIMTYAAVRISGKPADDEHHYGHGKFESVSALGETALLFLLSGVVIWEALARLTGHGHPVGVSAMAFVVMVVSVVVDFWRARLLERVARATKSEALEADALHFSSDMWSSLAVIVGLVGVAMGYPSADALAALVVAIFICLAGWRLGRRTIDTLLDTAPPGIAERLTAMTIRRPGVVAVERVRARAVGHALFVELTVAVSRTLPIDRVTALREDIARAIHADFPEAEITLTVAPRALDDETIVQRVNVIARNRALAVHHVTVHNLGGKLSVSLDLELDGDLALRNAHDIADALEHAVKEEIGADVEIDTHIEPLQPDEMSGWDASDARKQEIRRALTESAIAIGVITQVHDVRVRETDAGEIVNFHCRVDPARTVHEVHEKVDELERALRRQWPAIKRVIGHAEPLTAAPS